MQAFLDFLGTITHGSNRAERKAFSRLLPSVRDVYYRGYAEVLERAGGDRRVIEADLAVLSCINVLWQLVPDSLFTHRDVDYEELARASWRRVLSQDPPDVLVSHVSVVFRRLRQHYVGKFRKSTLDLGLIAHRDLLQEQNQRCAVCAYRFPVVSAPLLSDESMTFVEDYESREGEVVLSRYYRRPELDHILPYFIGGDGLENWQILCRTCNAGKGSSLAWLSRKGWMPPSGPVEARELSPSLRYVCIARDVVANDGRVADGMACRIFKKDSRGLVTLPNLFVRLC